MRFNSKLSQEILSYSELTVKDYKELLKAIYGEEVDLHLFADCLCSILSNLTNKPISYFKELNLVDIFCLLLDIRINSMGSTCSINLKNAHKKTTIELNLHKIKDSLIDVLTKHQAPIEINGVILYLEYPSFNRIDEDSEEWYSAFIKKVTYREHVLIVDSNKKASTLIDHLPLSIVLQLNGKIEQMHRDLVMLNFLSVYKITETLLNYTGSVSNLLWYVKLFFEEPLDVFYKNFFAMSYYAHMNSSYLENLSVGEYNYFVNCLRETLVPKQSTEDENSVYPDDPMVDQMVDSF
jgi:hypothetical protein